MKNIILILSVFVFSFKIFSQGSYPGKLGYGVSPTGHPHDYSQFGVFLQEVSTTCNGGVVYANGKWRDTITASGNIPVLQNTVCQLQPVPYNFVEMINFGWATYPLLHLNVPANAINNWTNTEMRNLFLQMLINTADSLQPAYFFIGNEVNFYWEQDSLDYLNWISFYTQAYDSIKLHSPGSKVGTTFNYEHLSGNGILTGWNIPYWSAFDILDTNKIDVIGITVYPFFNYVHSIDIPSNYLDPFFSRMGNKPVVISETGWPGDSLIGSWNASSTEQVNYVNKLFNIISGKNVEVVNWLFLNYMMDNTDTPSVKIFKSVALRDSIGNDRPALSAWLSQCNTASSPELNSETLKIYPNPCAGILTIDNNEKINYEIEIYDIYGKTVYRSEILNRKSLILNPDLPDGIYILQIKANNFIQTKKLEVIK